MLGGVYVDDESLFSGNCQGTYTKSTTVKPGVHKIKVHLNGYNPAQNEPYRVCELDSGQLAYSGLWEEKTVTITGEFAQVGEHAILPVCSGGGATIRPADPEHGLVETPLP